MAKGVEIRFTLTRNGSRFVARLAGENRPLGVGLSERSALSAAVRRLCAESLEGQQWWLTSAPDTPTGHAPMQGAAAVGAAEPQPQREPVRPEILTATEAAAYLRLHPGHLANLRTHGTGPDFVKLGQAVRYRRADLDRWVDSGRVVPRY